MNRGDIVLYKSVGLWYQKLIVKATEGPYVHVAIALSDTQVIAATTRGIDYCPFEYNPALHSIIALVPDHATAKGIETGLQWVLEQAGKRYSWIDIFYQAVKFLNPNNKLRFYCEGEFDCSDLVTRYLLHGGVQLPDNFQDGYANSPNDIARVYGLLPMRKG